MLTRRAFALAVPAATLAPRSSSDVESLDAAIKKLIALHAQHLGPIDPRVGIVHFLASTLEEDLEMRTDLDDEAIAIVVGRAEAIKDGVTRRFR